VYRPLLQEPQSIRLLQTTPGAEGSEIHCLIYDYTIRHDRASGPFESLSYVWGDPTERRRIYVRDAESTNPHDQTLSYLDVTVNLYAAMHRIRDPVFPRLVWIDAVCIDQGNLDERAIQVQFMATIYTYAIRVVVWLGEEADDSTTVFVQLEEGAQGSQYQPKLDHSADEGGPSLLASALLAFFRRPWFNRIWVSPCYCRSIRNTNSDVRDIARGRGR
jgi:hypothetical protein